MQKHLISWYKYLHSNDCSRSLHRWSPHAALFPTGNIVASLQSWARYFLSHPNGALDWRSNHPLLSHAGQRNYSSIWILNFGLFRPIRIETDFAISIPLTKQRWRSAPRKYTHLSHLWPFFRMTNLTWEETYYQIKLMLAICWTWPGIGRVSHLLFVPRIGSAPMRCYEMFDQVKWDSIFFCRCFDHFLWKQK